MYLFLVNGHKLAELLETAGRFGPVPGWSGPVHGCETGDGISGMWDLEWWRWTLLHEVAVAVLLFVAGVPLFEPETPPGAFSGL